LGFYYCQQHCRRGSVGDDGAGKCPRTRAIWSRPAADWASRSRWPPPQTQLAAPVGSFLETNAQTPSNSPVTTSPVFHGPWPGQRKQSTKHKAQRTKNKEQRTNMKQKLSPSRLLPLALAFSLIAAAHSQAAVSIVNFQLTTTSLSFDISGTMPATAPANNRNGFAIINPDFAASPGFALGNFTFADTRSFTGTQALSGILTGNSSGDYALVLFSSPLTAGEAISGTFSATWSTTAFDPAAVTQLNVQWGSTNGSSVGDGVQLALVPVNVPEPSGAALLLTGLAVAAGRRRRLS
jgi:hypothetical protein